MKILFFTAILFSGVLSEAQANSPSALQLARTTYKSVEHWYEGLFSKPTKAKLDRFTAWLFGYKANLVGLELDSLAALTQELHREGNYSIYRILREHADVITEAQPKVQVGDAWREVNWYPRNYGFIAGGHAPHLHEKVGDETALVFATSGLSDVAESVIENKNLSNIYTDHVVREHVFAGAGSPDEIPLLPLWAQRLAAGADSPDKRLADAKKMMNKTTRDRESLYSNGKLRIDDILLDSIYAAYEHSNRELAEKILSNIIGYTSLTRLDAAIRAAGGWQSLDEAMQGATQSARLRFSNSLVQAAKADTDEQLLSEVVLVYRLIRSVQKLEGGINQMHARSFGISKTPTDTSYSYRAHLEGERVFNFSKMQARIDSLRQQYPDNEELHNTLDAVEAGLKLKENLSQ